LSLDTVRNLEKPPLAPLRLLLDVPEAVLFDLDLRVRGRGDGVPRR
jgi:hypothetical protein